MLTPLNRAEVNTFKKEIKKERLDFPSNQHNLSRPYSPGCMYITYFCNQTYTLLELVYLAVLLSILKASRGDISVKLGRIHLPKQTEIHFLIYTAKWNEEKKANGCRASKPCHISRNSAIANWRYAVGQVVAMWVWWWALRGEVRAAQSLL
jgi:hypothetical protein